MTTLEDAARAYVKKHPKTPSNTPWTNGCARLMWDFGQSLTKGWATHGVVATAKAAMGNSDLMFPVAYSDIQVGRYVWLRLGKTGHVGIVVSGSGLDALVFWASDVLSVKLGDHIGFGTVRQYITKKDSKLLGVSEDYAHAHPNLSDFQSDSETPVKNPAMEATMKLIHVPATPTSAETFDICTDYTHRPVPHTDASIEAFLTGAGIEVVTAANRTIILAGIDANAKLLPKASTAAAIDYAALAKAVNDDAAKRLSA